MKKSINSKTILISIFLLSFITGCVHKTEEDKLYLTVREKSYVQYSQSDYYSNYVFSQIDLNGNITEIDEVTHFNYDHGDLYDKENQIIYFIDRIIENNIKEGENYLYSYDVLKKEYAAHIKLGSIENDMFKEGYTLFLVNRLNPRGPQIKKLDLNDNVVTDYNMGTDINVKCSDYNPVTKEIIFSAYSESERQNALNDLDYVPPNNTIYSFMDDKVEALFQTGNGEIGEIVANQDAVVYFRNLTILHNGENTGLEEVENSYFTYNRKTKETTKGVLGKELDNLVNILYLSEDSSYMYAVFKENKRDYQLARYEFKLGSKKLIYDFQSKYEDAGFRIVLMKEE